MPAFPAFPYFTGNGSAGGWGRPSCCLRAAGRFCSPAAWGTLRGCVPFPVNYSAVFPKSSMKVGIASEDRIGLDNRDGKTKAAGPSGRTSPGRRPRCPPWRRRGIDRRLAGRPHGGTDRPREQARLLEDRRLPLGKDPPVRIRGGGGEGQPEGCSGHRLRRSGERRERPAGGGGNALLAPEEGGTVRWGSVYRSGGRASVLGGALSREWSVQMVIPDAGSQLPLLPQAVLALFFPLKAGLLLFLRRRFLQPSEAAPEAITNTVASHGELLPESPGPRYVAGAVSSLLSRYRMETEAEKRAIEESFERRTRG